MTLYATLDFTKDELEVTSPTGTAFTRDDMRLLKELRAVSARIDAEFPQVPMWPYFAPWIGERTKSVNGSVVNQRKNTLTFSEHLLALTSVTLNGNPLAIGTDVDVWPDNTQPPFHTLRLLNWTASWYQNCDGCTAPPLVVIGGVWGFHRNYAAAWPQVDSLNAAVDAATNTIPLTNVGGVNRYGISPNISPGHLLQMDSELLEVTLVNAAANTVTALRGVNGSTAAAHNSAAPVLQWQVEDPVQEAVARQAGFQYARRGAYTTVQVQGMSEVRFPSDWLTEVRGMMNGYAYA